MPGVRPLEFSIDRFYNMNRRALIWMILFGVIWMLRQYFDVIFMVFVMCYLSAPVSRIIQHSMRIPHYLATTIVFLGLLFLGAGLVNYVTPKVVREAESVFKHTEKLQSGIFNLQKKYSDDYPFISDLVYDYFWNQVPPAVKEKKFPGVKDAESLSDETVLKLYLDWIIKRGQELVPQYVVLGP